MRTLVPETKELPTADLAHGLVEVVVRSPSGRVRILVLSPDRAAAFAAEVMRRVNDARDRAGVEAGVYDSCPMCGHD